ncbi:MAG: ABC transporter ATP-binding protein [Alphaproteobacteria bacterium]|jgi:lipoprotein-releasing system ATP-binding protein|nr:ABC transporter ATP-binding protein [Alphaproteobacteria bacterium]
MTATLELQNVTRNFEQGEETINVLRGIDLSIAPGEIVALVGPSGAGKTTLLQIAGLLELPSSGNVIMNGENCNNLSDKARTDLRREFAGFVYQFHYLLQEFSAMENVMLPGLIAGYTRRACKERAEELLEKLGLSHRLNHRPKKLSGGEQQRVAIARAIANRPKILLADEPTGNLDMTTAEIVFKEMIKLVRDTGLSALIATHNLDLAAKMDRSVRLVEGKLKVL